MKQMENTGKHILSIDNDAITGMLLQRILGDQGYEVSHVTSGQAGLDLIKKGGIDIVLTAITMPGINGIETAKQIKKSYDIPIVYVTTQPLNLCANQIEDTSDGYVAKPFTKDLLVEAIEHAFDSDNGYKEK